MIAWLAAIFDINSTRKQHYLGCIPNSDITYILVSLSYDYDFDFVSLIKEINNLINFFFNMRLA